MRIDCKFCRSVVAVFFILSFFSCKNYYKAIRPSYNNETEKAKIVDSLRLSSRSFILRNGAEAFYMKTPILSADQKTLVCNLEELSSFNKLHLTSGRKGNMQYIKNDKNDLAVLNEVHLYINPDTAAVLGRYTLSLDKVQKIEVIEKDRKRTTNSYVIGAIGISLSALAVATIIILATKSSCPFVSAYNGNEFVLQGEIYGGAIYPQMARHDYIPLQMSPLEDGTLQLKISNELKERQFTDMAELLVITHNIDTKIYADEKGNLYPVSNPQPPVSATLSNHKNILSSLIKAGDNEILYLDDSSQADAHNEVLINFKKPISATKGKLVLTLKNSYWLDLLYGELAKGFGKYYSRYMKKQHSKPLSKLLQWTKEQQMPLEIAVKSGDGWKVNANITTIGPLANRTIVVPVDLPSATDISMIKLSSGFMFWEIDCAAMDFSDDSSFTVQKLSPFKATDELGNNALPQLQKEDAVYLEQPLIGNIATLVYKTIPNHDNTKMQSYILHAKGYYEHIRDFKNKPDIGFLNQFKKPNAFPLYGMKLYNRIRSENLQTLAKKN
jgi:hypothetical protein